MQYSITEFEEIYSRCCRFALKLAMSLLHNEDDARDAVQEVFLRLWESNTRVENPQAFIVTSVRNTCLNRIAATDTRERFCRRLSLEEHADDIDTEQRSIEVGKALQSLLTSRERQIINKIYGEGLSYKATADTLDISVATVNKYVVTALKKLRTHFKSSDI